MKILIKRAYEDPAPQDGYRVLVDRVWPRGRTKNALSIDEWAKSLAPSTRLRQWFGHDPRRWKDFQKRYREELSGERDRLRELLRSAGRRPLTLVYGAKDEEHNQAVVLRSILSQMAKRG
ncbi:MAG TPA: DUF488 family protein [Xanthobacteraceae bacterium]|jgi:uncharacterized protein YeaO (DUF488 family)